MRLEQLFVLKWLGWLHQAYQKNRHTVVVFLRFDRFYNIGK